MTPKNHVRAVRYRKLALAELDKAKAAILNQIADEAERDVLCRVDKMDSGLPRYNTQDPWTNGVEDQ
jgi:hypothetical protein